MYCICFFFHGSFRLQSDFFSVIQYFGSVFRSDFSLHSFSGIISSKKSSRPTTLTQFFPPNQSVVDTSDQDSSICPSPQDDDAIPYTQVSSENPSQVDPVQPIDLDAYEDFQPIPTDKMDFATLLNIKGIEHPKEPLERNLSNSSEKFKCGFLDNETVSFKTVSISAQSPNVVIETAKEPACRLLRECKDMIGSCPSGLCLDEIVSDMALEFIAGNLLRVTFVDGDTISNKLRAEVWRALKCGLKINGTTYEFLAYSSSMVVRSKSSLDIHSRPNSVRSLRSTVERAKMLVCEA